MKNDPTILIDDAGGNMSVLLEHDVDERMQLLEERIQQLEEERECVSSEKEVCIAKGAVTWSQVLYRNETHLLKRSGGKHRFARYIAKNYKFVKNVPIKAWEKLNSPSKMEREFANSFLNQRYETT